MTTLTKMWRRARRSGRRLLQDRSGIAATEFAFIVPLMLVTFFATVELSAGIAVDRKVTLVARTLSDLVSQATSVTDNDLKNVFAASYGVLSPYPTNTASATISMIYVNDAGVAKVQWSKTATVAQNGSTVSTTFINPTRKQGDTIAVPTGLKVTKTYLVLSEVNYLYAPVVGYVVAKAGINLSDQSYTRPRQSMCVLYNPGSNASCPTF
ncbi:pilus assembly protein [Rhodopseudomonas sp. HC1]|uniref:TadE/TadG family type IV pilus assembly protein n=1 Tax=Rhodopseudomonas infernalis TaxID=2897386 RepID=UPI001EE7F646|nr:TadE/TadG family type IV pilus assembly protein [Rhodopseudomonas infernalis]MCG6203828.1 pilus assembly protein [Rhodopseudomonas infernalis]